MTSDLDMPFLFNRLMVWMSCQRISVRSRGMWRERLSSSLVWKRLYVASQACSLFKFFYHPHPKQWSSSLMSTRSRALLIIRSSTFGGLGLFSGYYKMNLNCMPMSGTDFRTSKLYVQIFQYLHFFTHVCVTYNLNNSIFPTFIRLWISLPDHWSRGLCMCVYSYMWLLRQICNECMSDCVCGDLNSVQM